MNLELKYIAPYLPHEIKALCEISGISDVVEVETYNVDHRIITLIDRHGNFLKNAKLILRPLSDLIKPCLERGRLPMMELARIEGFVDVSDPNPKVSEIKDSGYAWGIAFNIENDDDDDRLDVFGYDSVCGFGRHIRPSKEIHIVGNQLKLYEFLFKNHFDVFDLIGKKLAIDANTIKV